MSDDIFDILDEAVNEVNAEKIEEKPQPKKEEPDDTIFIPMDYQVFTTKDNKPDGIKEIIATYLCDRAKGIVPNQTAKTKADLMQKAFPNKTYFVIATYTVIRNGQKPVKESEIIHTTTTKK